MQNYYKTALHTAHQKITPETIVYCCQELFFFGAKKNGGAEAGDVERRINENFLQIVVWKLI